MSGLYRMEPVHVGRKLPVQAAGIKGETKPGGWSSEETKKFEAAWKGKGLSNAKDDAINT